MMSSWIATYAPGCERDHSLRCCSNTVSSVEKGPCSCHLDPSKFYSALLPSQISIITLMHYNVIMQRCDNAVKRNLSNEPEREAHPGRCSPNIHLSDPGRQGSHTLDQRSTPGEEKQADNNKRHSCRCTLAFPGEDRREDQRSDSRHNTCHSDRNTLAKQSNTDAEAKKQALT